jgi:hypothetical protein
MIKTALILSTALLWPTVSWSASINYAVIARADTKRIGEMVIRNSSSLDSPCLYIEVLDPERSWKSVQEKEICSINGRNFETDFSYASFSEVEFGGDSILATLTLIPLISVIEDNLQCSIKITDESIGELYCEPGREDQY